MPHYRLVQAYILRLASLFSPTCYRMIHRGGRFTPSPKNNVHKYSIEYHRLYIIHSTSYIDIKILVFSIITNRHDTMKQTLLAFS
jgi:hypothetical protein